MSELNAAPAPVLVAPEIWRLFPAMRLVVVEAHGVTVSEDARREIEERWRKAWTETASRLGKSNAQSHPRVRPWRERMRAIGVSGQKYPSSIEALLRRSLKGGPPPQINPIVDLYNCVSLSHVVPAGGFDLRDLRGQIQLRMSRPGDTFAAFDESDAQEIGNAEVCYAFGNRVLTRHFVWRQSKLGLIKLETESVLLVAEVLREVRKDEPSIAETVRRDLEGGLAMMATTVSSVIITSNRPWNET